MIAFRVRHGGAGQPHRHISNGGSFTPPQLKILQEGIALMVFVAFSILYLKESRGRRISRGWS